jgi:hypothetical protein
MVSDAIAGGNVSAINYFVAQKYVEALGKFADSPQQKTLLLPVEATGILGSLAGIAELAREAATSRGGGGGAPTPRAPSPGPAGAPTGAGIPAVPGTPRGPWGTPGPG